MSVPVPLALSLTPGLPRLRRPPETRPVVRNRTVLACCAGWSGPRCTEGRGWQRGLSRQQGTPAVARGRAASLCRRGRLAGALLRRVAVPGRAGCPQPLCREHGRVLPPALGAQLEERLLGALLRLRPPAPRRWVWGSRAAGGRARGSAMQVLSGARPPPAQETCPCPQLRGARPHGTSVLPPAASPGPAPGTAASTGGTSTSRASVPTAWLPPQMAPGLSPSPWAARRYRPPPGLHATGS